MKIEQVDKEALMGGESDATLYFANGILSYQKRQKAMSYMIGFMAGAMAASHIALDDQHLADSMIDAAREYSDDLRAKHAQRMRDGKLS